MSLVCFFIHARDDRVCGTVFESEEKTRQTFFPAVGILSGICLVLLLCVRVFHSERIVLRKGLSVFSPNKNALVRLCFEKSSAVFRWAFSRTEEELCA